MPVFEYFLIFILGLVFGSFISALTYRLPLGKKTSKGRSECDKCGKEILWSDNIPIISYVFLKGKCRNCKNLISPRYPLIEASTAIVFVLIFRFLHNCTTGISPSLMCNGRLSPGVALPYFLFLALIFITIFVIDLEKQIIPDELVFPAFLVALIVSVVLDFNGLFVLLASGFISSLFLLSLHLITRGRGMGLGDVKFALVGGMVVGWPGVLIWLFLSFLIGSIVGVLLILFGKAKFGRHIAFGPFLVISIFITAVWGEVIYRLLFAGFNF